MERSILELEQQIKSRKRYSHQELEQLVERTYELKRSALDNERYYRRLTDINDYLSYQMRKRDSMKHSLLTLINLLFLPLGVMVGYFGMNFGSMGNPDIRRGILSIEHSEWYILLFSISLIVIITWIFWRYYIE